VPTVRVETLNEAWPEPSKADEATGFPPSSSETVPVGVPPADVTLALNATGFPKNEAAPPPLRAAEVEALLMVSTKAVPDVEGEWVASPA
jgi:hypothetical protein